MYDHPWVLMLVEINCFVSECVDNDQWHNLFGFDCTHYTEYVCENGTTRPGWEGSLGSTYNYPENNCCACRKIEIEGKIRRGGTC